MIVSSACTKEQFVIKAKRVRFSEFSFGPNLLATFKVNKNSYHLMIVFFRVLEVS